MVIFLCVCVYQRRKVLWVFALVAAVGWTADLGPKECRGREGEKKEKKMKKMKKEKRGSEAEMQHKPQVLFSPIVLTSAGKHIRANSGQ